MHDSLRKVLHHGTSTTCAPLLAVAITSFYSSRHLTKLTWEFAHGPILHRNLCPRVRCTGLHASFPELVITCLWCCASPSRHVYTGQGCLHHCLSWLHALEQHLAHLHLAASLHYLLQASSIGGAGRLAGARGKPATPCGAPASGPPHPPHPGQEGG